MLTASARPTKADDPDDAATVLIDKDDLDDAATVLIDKDATHAEIEDVAATTPRTLSASALKRLRQAARPPCSVPALLLVCVAVWRTSTQTPAPQWPPPPPPPKLKLPPLPPPPTTPLGLQRGPETLSSPPRRCHRRRRRRRPRQLQLQHPRHQGCGRCAAADLAAPPRRASPVPRGDRAAPRDPRPCGPPRTSRPRPRRDRSSPWAHRPRRECSQGRQRRCPPQTTRRDSELRGEEEVRRGEELTWRARMAAD